MFTFAIRKNETQDFGENDLGPLKEMQDHHFVRVERIFELVGNVGRLRDVDHRQEDEGDVESCSTTRFRMRALATTKPRSSMMRP